MRNALWIVLSMTVGIAAALPAAAQVDAKPEPPHRTVAREIGSDRFVAGGSVRIDQPVPGDLIAAGGALDVDAPVGGDAVVAGGNVRIDDAIGASLYAAGGRLYVNGSVGRNARIGGGQVDLSDRAEIAGNLTIGGGEVRVNGPVKGYLQAGGGNVLIDSAVGGDVVVTGGMVELGPRARIAGRLRYASNEEIRRDPAAQVGGGIERMAITRDGGAPGRGERTVIGRHGSWGWSIGLVALAAALAAALPAAATRVSDTLRTRWPLSLLIGFIALVCIPTAALILLFTVIGVPLALLSVALYLALLLFGYVSAGAAGGVIALQRLQPARAAHAAWRAGAAALGMLAVTLLARVPVVGGLVVLVAMLLGIGALLLQWRRPAAA